MPASPETLIGATLDCGMLTAAQAARLRDELRAGGADPIAAIERACRAPVTALYRALAEARGLPFLDAATLEPPPELTARLPELIARRKQVLAISDGDDGVMLASTDPDDAGTQAALERIFRKRVLFSICEPRALDAAIERAFGRGAPARAGPVVDATALLDDLMREALIMRASDLHVEPMPTALRVRFRVDGHLQGRDLMLGAELSASLVSRVKVLAGLDISERRSPQDGGMRYQAPGSSATVDIRVATAPTIHGERATLRLLGVETDTRTLETLGLAPSTLAALRTAIRRPHGIVLLTGPTGSGKSTTLYAALREIATPEQNVLTVEDPVEQAIAGVSQMQVDSAGKMPFARALRALLRHDPDVLMVGEIRDQETAEVALRAAMTGHLVLSTLHTQSALGAVSRLCDLGCEPFLVAETLSLALAQRLVRRLCQRCKRSRAPDEVELTLLRTRADPAADAGALRVFEPVGCAACLGTGYRGRMGIAEAVPIGGPLVSLIARRAPEEALRAIVAGTTLTLRDDGIDRVLAGLTSVSEVLDATVGT